MLSPRSIDELFSCGGQPVREPGQPLGPSLTMGTQTLMADIHGLHSASYGAKRLEVMT